jgi:hypothetical protein
MTHYSKFSPVIDILITQFQDLYSPEEELTVDEVICPFQGRIFFHVYMKGKPHKYGIKMFELCKAKRGYINNPEVYTWAHPTNSEHNTDCVTPPPKGGGGPQCVHGQMVLQSKNF